MTSPILVTGGTGTLGARVVRRLVDSGSPVRVLSRRPRTTRNNVEYVAGDLLHDEGIAGAVDGASIIVHCAGAAKGDDKATENLVRAARQIGAPHFVYISVIGADRIPVSGAIDRLMFGYFAAKRDAERTIAGSGLPYSTLRAAQFQESMGKVVRQMARLPVVLYPRGFRFQPVAVGAVADRLVEIALGRPLYVAAEMAGSQTWGMDDLAQSYLRVVGKHRPMLSIPLPGAAARAFREGANLAPPQHMVDGRTWEEFLVEFARNDGLIGQFAAASRER